MTSATKDFYQVDINDVADYWNQRPCNLRHSAAPAGTREFFDQVEARKYFVEPHIPLFADFGRWQGKKVLEIGCGLGTDTINFARHGAYVTAVDVSAESLALAQKRADLFGMDGRIRFVHANVERLSSKIRPQPFDLIYSFGALHHTPRPDHAFRALCQYTGPATELRIMLYHWRSTKVAALVTRARLHGDFRPARQIVAEYSEAQTGCPVTYCYTKDQAVNLLAECGWDVTSLKIAHIFPYRVKDYVNYRYRKALPWNLMPTRVFASLENRIGWHLLIKAKAISK